MKTKSRTRTAGAVIRPGDRSAGNWSRNGCGTSASNWGTNRNRYRCALPNSLLLSCHRASMPPRIQRTLRPHQDTAHPPLPRPGKRIASQDTISLSNPMEPCVAQQAARSPSRSGGERLMGACDWCMPPAFASVAPVNCVSNVSGMGAPLQSRAK
jgi:hypothetical protein